MEIGNQIKALRTRRGITQDTLAAELGVSPQAVSKWECGTALPDIGLLPAISAYFGVAIDELFALSDDTRMERIQNMLWDTRVLDPNRVEAERQFLLEKARREPKNEKPLILLADMEYQLAEERMRQSAEYAEEAIRRAPENNDAHSTFVQASRGAWGAWLSTNHHELIDFYKAFVAEHPKWRSGYLWLLDQLIDDNRLEEAREYCEQMESSTDCAFRAPLYRGDILWAEGKQDESMEVWEQMCRDYPDHWNVWLRMGDIMARLGRYEEAKAYYRKSMDIQTARPRYTDGITSIAHVCEIQKDYDGAIAAHEEELDILRTEWDISTGEQVDQHHREIARLKALRERR